MERMEEMMQERGSPAGPAPKQPKVFKQGPEQGGSSYAERAGANIPTRARGEVKISAYMSHRSIAQENKVFHTELNRRKERANSLIFRGVERLESDSVPERIAHDIDACVQIASIKAGEEFSMEEIRSALAKCNRIPGNPEHKSWPIQVQLHPGNGRMQASLLGRNNLLSELNNSLHTQISNPQGSHKGTARDIHGGEGRCREENVREGFRPNMDGCQTAVRSENCKRPAAGMESQNGRGHAPRVAEGKTGRPGSEGGFPAGGEDQRKEGS
jgi:hypothetical protein